MTSVVNRTTYCGSSETLRPSDLFTVGYLKHLDFCVDVGFVARA